MKSQASLLSVLMMLSTPMWSSHASASEISEGFQVSDIQIDGLVRVAPETVYAELPINSGEIVSPKDINFAIKKLYNTGLFSNILAKRNGGQLVFKVTERPVITGVEFEGNTVIPTEALKTGFEQVGIKKGEPLNEAILAKVEKDIAQQYLSQGRYNAKVIFEQSANDNNTVNLTAKFYEGTPARIVDIKVFGNTVFSDSDIKDELLINETDFLSFFDKKDRFSKPKFLASLEKVKSLYYNDGYINFEINDSIINISEDKQKIYIELSVTEGDKHTFGKVNFIGDTRFSDEKLAKQSVIKTNETFTQDALVETSQNLEELYGNEGFFYANVRPVPRVNKENKVVDVDVYIDPGRPIYVRKINFVGNVKTEDHVLRREMRQLEGAMASRQKIQLSKTRLLRTGFFKSVDMQVSRIPGIDDKVDISVNVAEESAGSTNIQAGYSQNAGFTFQLGLTQRNFFGTGNAVDIQFSRSETLDNYSLSVNNPYFTVDGVNQNLKLYYRETKVDNLNVNNYLTDSLGASLSYGYPVDEDTRLSLGVGVDNTKVKAGPNIAISNMDYMLKNGVEVKGSKGNTKLDSDDLFAFDNANRYQSEYLTYNLNFGWLNSTLDKPIFPNKGMSHKVNAEVAIPGSDVSYQKLTYTGNFYQPLGYGFVARAYSKLGYGNNLPFYKNYSAGGFGTIRGFKTGTLGPRSDALVFVSDALKKGGKATKDPNPEHVGGNTLIQGGVELALPLPFLSKYNDKIRTVLFAETAKLYDTNKIDKRTFKNTGVPLINQDLDFKYSVGISATWITPIVPLTLIYAFPISPDSDDQTQSIQFEIGRIF